MNTCLMCERDTVAGYLCGGCRRATAARLDRMPKLWSALAAFLPPGGRATTQYGRARAAEAPLPVAEEPLSLRGPGGMVGTLESWRAALHADRGWDEPVVCVGIGERVTAAASALLMSMEWVATEWPAAGDMARAVKELERAAMSVVDAPDPAKRPVRLGPCPALVEGGQPCGAVLRYFPGDADVRCRWCRSSWPVTLEALARVKGWMDEDAKEATEESSEDAASAAPEAHPSHA
ncbi:hypothetical protein KQY30_20010 [Streptomyces sp. GMY02]|uniref:hypothetical protein n=1 Tax=Streptomyces sp. GMY02 TaxID=1333528 RepID=UPI001C2BD79A|nr:hypothetical protein [Streptomyces sp. GMY02]QXE36186.1 hypothetical protein KQY30_20010 [Streptomyces sp. GMY02]